MGHTKRPLIRKVSRRHTLQGLSATLGAAALGCGDDGGQPDAGNTTGGPAGTDTGTPNTGSTASDATTIGSAGTDSTGQTLPPAGACEVSELSTQELLASVDHIIVLMMENRSFDHYLGALALEGAAIEGLSGRESNPDGSGRPVGVFRSEQFVINTDPPHGWTTSRSQWNKGANDGFVQQYIARGAPNPELVMGYHTRDQLTPLYTLASNFVTCDRWFSSVMGPTQPNRFHMHLGSSLGLMENPAIGDGPTGVTSIFDRLDDAGVSHSYYSSNIPFPISYGRSEGIANIGDFFTAAQKGTLPSFCMVDPAFTAAGLMGNDDHPPADINLGQAFIASVYEALAQSPQWDRCLLLITYDEHGGFYDHVSPPMTVDTDYPEFQQLGFRVPTVAVGPHVRRGCVSSVQMDHVSIPATVTRKWDLEPLNDRVAATTDFSNVIDPAFIDNPQPPVALPSTLVRMPTRFRTDLPEAQLHHIELVQLLDSGRFPKHLDRRAQHEDTMREVLEIGRRLGVVHWA